MKLSKEQVQAYERDGYLVLPNLFNAAEVDVLRRELAAAVQVQDERVIREKTGLAVRMVYGVHDRSGPTGHPGYASLVGSPRLVQPAMDVLGEPVNVFHTKANLKEAINGEFWQWHQDFGYWNIEDAAPQPRLVTSLVMLDRATEVGGCLYFVPGSHRLGMIEPAFDERTSKKIWTVSKEQMIDAVQRCGEPVAVTGDAGTVVMFHPNLLHGSAQNMSTHDRRQLYVVYNAVSNKLGPVANPRPEYNASRTAPAQLPNERDVIAGAEAPAFA